LVERRRFGDGQRLVIIATDTDLRKKILLGKDKKETTRVREKKRFGGT